MLKQFLYLLAARKERSKTVPPGSSITQQAAAAKYEPAKTKREASQLPVDRTIQGTKIGKAAEPSVPAVFIVLKTEATCRPPMSIVIE